MPNKVQTLYKFDKLSVDTFMLQNYQMLSTLSSTNAFCMIDDFNVSKNTSLFTLGIYM